MEAVVQAQCLPSLEPLGFGLGHPSETLYPTDPQDTPLYPSDPHAASLCPTDPQALPGTNPENSLLHASPPSPDVTSFSQSDATISLASTGTSLNGEEDEDECLVETQSICFSENPFLVANRRGKGRPPAERILSGPPVGYGRGGKLQPWMYTKARGTGPAVGCMERRWGLTLTRSVSLPLWHVKTGCGPPRHRGLVCLCVCVTDCETYLKPFSPS